MLGYQRGAELGADVAELDLSIGVSQPAGES